MPGFIPWNSQPLAEWTTKHAGGKIIELDGLSTHYIITPADKYPRFVIPAQAGIQQSTGCRIKSGMTALAI